MRFLLEQQVRSISLAPITIPFLDSRKPDVRSLRFRQGHRVLQHFSQHAQNALPAASGLAYLFCALAERE